MSFPGKLWSDVDESTLSANVYPKDGTALLVPLGLIRRPLPTRPLPLPNKKKSKKRLKDPLVKAFQALEGRR